MNQPPEYDHEIAVRTWLTAGTIGGGFFFQVSEGLNPANRTIAATAGFIIGVVVGAVYDWMAYKRKGGGNG